MKNILKHLKKNWIRYAFESIAIIISILAAFALNNWNENRKRKSTEIEILEQLLVEVDGNLTDIEGDIFWINQFFISYDKIWQYIEEDMDYADSMALDFMFITWDQHTINANAAYDRLRNEGMYIIRNDTLRTYIERTFEAVLPRLEKNNAFYESMENHFGPFFSKHFYPNRDSALQFTGFRGEDTIQLPYRFKRYDGKWSWNSVGYIPKDFENLKNNSEFQMLLRSSSRAMNHKMRHYKQARRRLKKLQADIKSELKRLK